MRLCKSPHAVGERAVSSARSLKLTRKNSSCGLAVLEELTRGIAGFYQSCRTCCAKIKDDSDGDRHCLRKKGEGISCSMCVLEDAEIVGFQTSDQGGCRVCDGHVDQWQIHVGADDLSGDDLSLRGIPRERAELWRRGRSLCGYQIFWGHPGPERGPKTEQQQAREQARNRKQHKTRVSQIARFTLPLL